MDRITKAKVDVMSSIIKLTTDAMISCKDLTELEIFRKMLLDNVNSLYIVLHEENGGVYNE